MKRIFLILGVLFTFVAVNAQQAQTTPTPQERAHNQALRLKKLVSLSDEQTTKVEAVFLSRAIAVDAIEADAAKTPEQKKADIKKVREEKDNELKAILTAEQYTQYEQQKANRKARQAATNGQ